jgi:hypothetical protein
MATRDAEKSNEKDFVDGDDIQGVHQSSQNRKPGRLFREGFWVAYATEGNEIHDEDHRYETLSPRRLDYEWKYVYASTI